MTDYRVLLTAYADRLIQNQLQTHPDPAFRGAILCPACAHIHGRMGDCVYPLVSLFDHTKNEKYLTAAKLAVEWSENNVARRSGAYFNDKSHHWIGITVFSAISLGEALFKHGACLDASTRDAWTAIFLRLTGFVRERFLSGEFHTYTNYFASFAAHMALAYRLTGDEGYKADAYRVARHLRDTAFTPEGLLMGEGGYVEDVYPKGTHPVDIGYNVEESLPALALFAHLTEDAEYLAFVTRAFEAHLSFLLPDGAWDNSFGTRADKWTYWGSRTSDGCQTGLVYLAKESPLLAAAAERNLALLAHSSKDGYLYGGYQYVEAGEEPCIHHTFCHAKALAAMLDAGFVAPDGVRLPSDDPSGLAYYPSMDLYRVSMGDLRADVSGYDVLRFPNNATSGGTLTLLWHAATGPLLAATPAAYRTAEPHNMQLSRRMDEMYSLSPRIAAGASESVYDTSASLSAKTSADAVEITAEGRLKNIRGEGDVPYTLSYRFTADALTLTARAAQEATLALPLLCDADSTWCAIDGGVHVTRKNATVTLLSDAPITPVREFPEKIFHVVGGFLAIPFALTLKPHETIRVTLRVEA